MREQVDACGRHSRDVKDILGDPTAGILLAPKNCKIFESETHLSPKGKKIVHINPFMGGV